MIQTLPLKEIKPNPENPRSIREEKFHQLVESITNFPDMLFKRPLVVDENNVVLGGNMRLRALTAAGIHEVPVIVAEGWTEEQKREFIIKDNVSFGEWDWDALANEWGDFQLTDWGLDVWEPELDVDYGDLDGDVEQDIELIEQGGRKAIMIDFALERYGHAAEIVSKARAEGINIGEALIETLENRLNV